MADFSRILLLFWAICLAERAQGSLFGIVEPFPKNIYPLEYTSAQVTCVAFDSQGLKVPSKIQFMRRDEYNFYVKLEANDNLSFENKTEIINGNNTKLSVTLFIRNVTVEDDSLFGQLGSYECHAFAVGDVNERARHGFSVSVITRKEIPIVVVPDTSILQHNDDITLVCNLTERGSLSTPLKRISWFKDGKPLESVRNPDPQNSQDTLGPLKLKSVSVRDGGNYTCLLEVLLRNVKAYNVSDHTMIHIAPWLPKPKEDIEEKAFKGGDVSFECAARGFPLEVEWKVKRKDQAVQSCINGSSGHYKIQRDSVYDPYFFTISDVQYTDRGSYYCCLPSNCSDNIDDNCQRFILRVRDPLGALWPVIGILIEAIVLFLIIFIAEKRKKNKEKGKMAEWNSATAPPMTGTGDKCACAKWVKLQLPRRACSRHVCSSCLSQFMLSTTALAY
ncbi:hypothetical protein OS493_037525 [Desmophyllum pertusum]|uniref:Ig-like domain-containing protein n=1 Tax=Desmophyllum pertusum TaxID=174260 RepID=A0A9W9ZVF5_9CNID|nr:hypothetical protein OS493_037525 [Desmophyllum pertusum]